MKALERILIFFKKSTDDAVGAYAAFAAFFVIVSFFPFVMLLLTLLQFLPFSPGDLSQYIEMILPTSVVDMIDPIIAELYDAGSGLISLTAIAAIWAASKGVYALVCGLNSVYGVKETRNIIVVRAMSVFYTVVMLLVLTVSIGVLLFGGQIFALIEQIAPWVIYFSNLRYLIGLFVFALFFLAIFCTLPNRRTRPSAELPGAVIAALGWVLFSIIYSYYIDHFSSFPLIYGSIAAVVFLMLWLYFCMYITLLAAEINSMSRRNAALMSPWGN